MSTETDDRWYPNPWDPASKPFPSVTTILGATVEKPGIPGWTGRLAAQYALDHLDDLGKLAASGQEKAALGLIAGAADRFRDAAAERGKALHAVAEAEAKGEPISLPPEMWKELEPYLETLDRYNEEMRPVVELSESKVYSKRYDYAGTLDGIVSYPAYPQLGRRLFDFKTGAKGPYLEQGLQNVGYEMCDWIDVDGIGTLAPMPKLTGGTLVFIRPDGYKVIPVRITRLDRANFIRARRMFAWLREDSKGMFGRQLHPDGLSHLQSGDLDIRVRTSLLMRHGISTIAGLHKLGLEEFEAIKFVGPAQVLKARALLAVEGMEWTTDIEPQGKAA